MVPGLSFHLEKNYGIAFGVPVPGTILMVLICAALVYLVYELIRAHARQASTLVAGLGMILTGTMSNLLDRAWPGYVIDYIDVRFFSVFNLADVLITLGVGIILLQSLRRRPIR
jgi:signal peptidase II